MSTTPPIRRDSPTLDPDLQTLFGGSKITEEKISNASDPISDESCLESRAAKQEMDVITSKVAALRINRLLALGLIPNNPFVIDAKTVQKMLNESKLSIEQLLQELVELAQKPYARAPISGYNVCVAGLTKRGAIYLGVNLEFPQLPLFATVHAEGFLLAQLQRDGEELDKIYLSAEPCGHCRQLFQEIGEDITVLVAGKSPTTLSALLPNAFGPKNLGHQAGILTPSQVLPSEESEEKDMLIRAAKDAANASYTPYTNSPSGVAMEMHDGTIITGSYLEAASYNQSLTPMQTALISLVAQDRDYKDIKQIVLVEKASSPVKQGPFAKLMAESIVPHVQLSLMCPSAQ